MKKIHAALLNFEDSDDHLSLYSTSKLHIIFVRIVG